MQPTYGDIAGYHIARLQRHEAPVSPVLRGWDQTYEFRVIDTRKGRFAYCGNGAMGWSIVDVSDPRHMRVVWRQPHTHGGPPMAGQFPTDNTQYIDIKGDHILVVKRNRARNLGRQRSCQARPAGHLLAPGHPPDDECAVPWLVGPRGARPPVRVFRVQAGRFHCRDIGHLRHYQSERPDRRGALVVSRNETRRGVLRTWWSPENPDAGPAPAPHSSACRHRPSSATTSTWKTAAMRRGAIRVS